MKDQNGQTICRNVKRHEDGTWGVNVWFGNNPPTNARRAFYRTKAQARDGDISHCPGEGGCIRFGEYERPYSEDR